MEGRQSLGLMKYFAVVRIWLNRPTSRRTRRLHEIISAGIISLLVGCGPLLDRLHGEPKEPALSADAHVEIFQDSLQIITDYRRDYRLMYAYDAQHVEVHGLRLVLEGPGGVTKDRQAGLYVDDWGFDSDWPDGTYTLRITGYGKVLASRTFEVKRGPGLEANGAPMVITRTEPPMMLRGKSWSTWIAMDVTRPNVDVEYVVMRGNQIVGDPKGTITNIDSLHTGKSLGTYKHAVGSAPDDLDLTGTTIFLFEHGEQLIGAWAYADATDKTLALARVTPPAKQLAIALDAAAGVHDEDNRIAQDLGIRVDERVVCAVVGSREAHELYVTLQSAEMDAGYQMYAQLDAQDQLEDRSLSRRERAKLEDKRRTAASYAMADGLPMQRAQKKLAQLVHKYRKGCLAELGVPRLVVR
jgi:hypothetical protein